MQIKFREWATSPVFACTIRQMDGRIVYDYTTHWANQPTPDFEANAIVEVEYSLVLNHLVGMYYLGVDLAYCDLSYYYDRMVRALDFVVTGGDGSGGVANLKASFSVVEVISSGV